MAIRIPILEIIDFYKAGHPAQYPKNTEFVMSNLTPRGSRTKSNRMVFSGGQYYFKEYLIKEWNETFFDLDKDFVIKQYKRRLDASLGKDSVDVKHIEALHDLGYLPIQVNALPEGQSTPMRVPVLTLHNTHKDFGWLPNYLESSLSNMIWKSCTSATTAFQYLQTFHKYAELTGYDKNFIPFQGHDFSFRGMSGVEDACLSGFGHLLSFVGTDTVPTASFIEQYYNADADKELIACSVPATEHAVMSLHGNDNEFELFKKLITETYPSGIVSIVSDTWNLWKVLTDYMPRLKDEIMARDGRVVIRPDCYSDDTLILTKCGWKLFKNLNDNDLVAQVLDDGSHEFVKPLKYVNEYYSGDMYHFFDHHGKMDLLVTPNHRMIFKTNKWVVQEAKDVPNNGRYMKDIMRSSRAQDNESRLTPIEKLKIMFQADGSYCNTTDGSKSKTKYDEYKIRGSFNKERKIKKLKILIKEANLTYSEYHLKDGKTEIQINIPNHGFTKDFSWVTPDKLSLTWSREFIEELSYWDATRRSDSRFKFDTTDKCVMDVVEMICMAAGYGILISEYKDDRKKQFSNIFTGNILKNNFIDGQSIKKEKINYSGNVHCVTVPTGKLIVKRNRCTAICGNSGDPVDIICGQEFYSVDKYMGNEFNMEVLKHESAETLHEILQEETPHGKYGGPITELFISFGKIYEITYDPDWNRYNKQYYFIDNYGSKKSKITIKEMISEPEQIGAYELLWNTFGGIINKKNFKELDTHVGLIYGDAITLDRQEQILQRLMDKGFSASNLVLGIGSYTYTYVTRDTYGTAMKATFGIINGKEKNIYKDPITDNGLKKSAKGRLAVTCENGELVLHEELTQEEYDKIDNVLIPVFKDGKMLKEYSLIEIRKNIQKQI